ncbi:MAG: Fe-S metabolism protein SufE [Gammaproteobacteria bacterium SG8_47]|nr:MAG: Fe-S metabolism protein SufE [Gammaproteobacteria bacterium SG8_47]
MHELDEVVDAFELLGDWDQRYQYLVELGERLGQLPQEAYVDDNKVTGCMSQVWVMAMPDQGDPERLHFAGDCDTSVIKGVLALLIQVADGKTLQELDAFDVDEMFERLQLDDHLSPNRHVGVYAIVEKMKQQARLALPEQRSPDRLHAGRC